VTNPQVQLAAGDLTGRADFQRGQLFVSPSRRLIGGPAGERKLQPQVMRVLLCLMDRDGEVVLRRTLFDQCWSGTPVGEDSLNRVLMSIRRGLAAVGAEAATIETIPGSGYRFSGSDDGRGAALDRALEEAFDCWRTGAPGIHAEEIATLERLAVENPSEPRLWGRLALLLRKAAEYADAADCAAYVARCERAARRAFELEPEQSDARVAMAGLAPIFGAWADTREQLLRVLSDDPDHVPARHDLAVLEMATGRLSAASPLMARLIAEDSFAATYHYTRF
jgi:DNA-binding winged helix-turn-helix (wHTH) protein